MATKPIAHFNFRRRLYMFKITKEYDMNYRRLVYRPEEYSFDSIPLKNSDYYILFDTLQLGFDSESNACVQIFGFFPQVGALRKSDSPCLPRKKTVLQGEGFHHNRQNVHATP